MAVGEKTDVYWRKTHRFLKKIKDYWANGTEKFLYRQIDSYFMKKDGIIAKKWQVTELFLIYAQHGRLPKRCITVKVSA